jgi:hypothetical protein
MAMTAQRNCGTVAERKKQVRRVLLYELWQGVGWPGPPSYSPGRKIARRREHSLTGCRSYYSTTIILVRAHFLEVEKPKLHYTPT